MISNLVDAYNFPVWDFVIRILARKYIFSSYLLVSIKWMINNDNKDDFEISVLNKKIKIDTWVSDT